MAVLLLTAPAAAFAGSPSAHRADVVVPRASGGVVAVYGRLHAAGLRVSIPRGWSFDSLRPPRVARIVPASGRRVRRGSVVTLYLSCCRRLPGPRVPAGRPPTYVVPDFVWSAASVAYTWTRNKLYFRAHLGPLKGGDARGLLLNYRVRRQAPTPGRRLAPGRRTRRANRVVVQPMPLTVWGSQSPPCAPPPGYTVVASNAQAVITSHAYARYGTPYLGWYGCLRALGAQRRLTSGQNTDGAYEKRLGQAVVAGRFVAFSFGYADKYFTCTNSIEIYDLTTGRPGRVFVMDCSYPGPVVPRAIDSLAVNAYGFAAWRLMVRDSTGAEVAQLYAFDTHGTRLLDSSAPGAGASLTGINLRGNLLTWSNAGTSRQATLG